MAAVQQQEPEQEIIIRFTKAWWGYLLFRLGALRALVNGIEDALAIAGRFLLLVFLIYCGAKAGILLSDPTAVFPPLLEMSMFILQLAGLEGSIPGLARQADLLRERRADADAEKLERVMLSARIMTVLSIAEGALHALHIDPTFLQWMSALLLIARGVVITNFLISLARMEVKGPRVLSKEAQARELARQALRDEQARTITDLTEQLKETREARVHAQQNEGNQERIIAQLQAQVRLMKEGQGTVTQTLHSQLSQLQSDLADKTAELSKVRQLLQNASQSESSLQANLQVQMKVAREEMQARMKAEIDELRRVNADLKAQMKVPAKPTKQVARQLSSEKFDARTFVFACLQSDPTMKLSEIVKAAKMKGQELSEPTISRYRKEYRESSTVVINESSAI